MLKYVKELLIFFSVKDYVDKQNKKLITLRLDKNVVDDLRKIKNYNVLVNDLLKKFLESVDK